MESASWRIIKIALCHQLLTKFQLPHEFIRWLHLPLQRERELFWGWSITNTVRRSIWTWFACPWCHRLTHHYLSQHGTDGIILHTCTLCSRITAWEQFPLLILSLLYPMKQLIIGGGHSMLVDSQYKKIPWMVGIKFLKLIVPPERTGHSAELRE